MESVLAGLRLRLETKNNALLAHRNSSPALGPFVFDPTEIQNRAVAFVPADDGLQNGPGPHRNSQGKPFFFYCLGWEINMTEVGWPLGTRWSSFLSEDGWSVLFHAALNRAVSVGVAGVPAALWGYCASAQRPVTSITNLYLIFNADAANFRRK